MGIGEFLEENGEKVKLGVYFLVVIGVGGMLFSTLGEAWRRAELARPLILALDPLVGVSLEQFAAGMFGLYLGLLALMIVDPKKRIQGVLLGFGTGAALVGLLSVGLFIPNIDFGANIVLIVGGVLSWQAYQQQQAFEQMGSMMGTSMSAVHGTNPLLYVLGTLLVSAVVGGGYLVVRDEFTTTEVADRSQTEMANPTDSESIESQEEAVQSEGKINPESQPQARVLDLLPDDERRILEPVLSSPGITQIELRDRSNFSKSKVSQTVSALEKRGLLYRERQGRTYRIYPSDDLEQKQAN